MSRVIPRTAFGEQAILAREDVMVERARQRAFVWVTLWIGIANVCVAGFTLWTLTPALRERRLPEEPSYDVASLSGGSDEASAALATWSNFAMTGQSTSGDVIAQVWLIIDALAFALLGYGLVAVATILLASRGAHAGRTSNRRFVLAGALGIVLVIVDVIETVLALIVIGRDGNGPAAFLRWWTYLKWIIVLAVLVAFAVALVAVVQEGAVGRRIKRLFTGPPAILRWAKRVAGAALVLAASIIVLAILADRGAHPIAITVVGILFAVAAFLFNAAIEAGRLHGDPDRVLLFVRVTCGAELMVIGLCLIAAWAYGSPPSGIGFTGVVATVFGASGLLGEFRWNDSTARTLIALALVAGAGVAGLAALLVPSPFVGIALLFVAIFVLGVVGLSGVTEDVLRFLADDRRSRGGRRMGARRWVLFPVGAALTASAAIWAISDDWTTRNLVFGAALLVVFALVVGSNWSSEAFIAVGAIVIVWALSPSVGAVTDTITPASGDDVMVVLGDSYTSGEGGSTFFEGTNTSRAEVENKCRRSPNASAVRLAEDPGDPVPSRIVFVACSGATLDHITTDAQYVGEPPDRPIDELDDDESLGLSQLEHVDWVDRNVGGTLDIDTVLVGTGGNDAGFGEIVGLCVLPGDCSELAEQWIDDLQALRPSLATTFRRIRDHFGDDVAYVAMPYPIPIGPEACDQSHFTDDEHRFLFNYVEILNGAIGEAAAASGFHMVEDVEEALTPGGNGICTGSSRGDLGINYLAVGQERGVFEDQVDPRNWLHNSMHPNDDGHALIATAAADWFVREEPGALVEPDATNDTGTGTVLTIDDLIGRSDDYCSEDPPFAEPSECEYEGYEWAAAQGLESVRRHAPLALVGFAGIWLLVTGCLALFRAATGGRRPSPS